VRYLPAAVLIGAVLLAQEPSPAGRATANPVLAQDSTATRREWKHLRSQAHTTGEFDRLSSYARQRSAFYQHKELACQKELREYYSHAWGVPEPKFPPRDQALKDLIASYDRSSAYWSRQAENLDRRAEASRQSEAVP